MSFLDRLMRQTIGFAKNEGERAARIRQQSEDAFAAGNERTGKAYRTKAENIERRVAKNLANTHGKMKKK